MPEEAVKPTVLVSPSMVAAAFITSGTATVRAPAKFTVNVWPETPFVAAKMFSEPRTIV